MKLFEERLLIFQVFVLPCSSTVLQQGCSVELYFSTGPIQDSIVKFFIKKSLTKTQNWAHECINRQRYEQTITHTFSILLFLLTSVLL